MRVLLSWSGLLAMECIRLACDLSITLCRLYLSESSLIESSHAREPVKDFGQSFMQWQEFSYSDLRNSCLSGNFTPGI